MHKKYICWTVSVRICTVLTNHPQSVVKNCSEQKSNKVWTYIPKPALSTGCLKKSLTYKLNNAFSYNCLEPDINSSNNKKVHTNQIWLWMAWVTTFDWGCYIRSRHQVSTHAVMQYKSSQFKCFPFDSVIGGLLIREASKVQTMKNHTMLDLIRNSTN